MTSHSVVLRAIFESHFYDALLGCSHFAVMQIELFGECAGLPSLHARADIDDAIHRAALCRNVTPNLVIASTTEQLATTGDVLDAHKAVIVSVIVRVAEPRAD